MWICNIAESLKIKLNDFGIKAETPDQLIRITKDIDAKDDPRFKALFKEFLKKAASQNFMPLLKLQKVVRLVLEENYKLDINKLKNA